MARRFVLPALIAISAGAWLGSSTVALADNDVFGPHKCDDNSAICTEPAKAVLPGGYYIGHDEPSILFLDSHAGSGNSATYRIRLPKEPTTQPTQDGANGVAWDFELRATYWFGMVMCDTQSAPEFTQTCAPDTDANIFDSNDPANPHYIGYAPGSAYMELQLYAPGWVPQFTGFGCPGLKWCVALTIDSFNQDLNHRVLNNADCLSRVGLEPANFAYLTHSGVPHGAPDPISILAGGSGGNPDPTTDLQMNPGDQLTLTMHDTPAGFWVQVHDRTTGQTGSMTASVANGFQQVDFDPSASTCTETPYAFHPMFSTSSTRTRASWTAHGYNVATSDEIGHFEWCDQVAPDFTCASASEPGEPDGDEFPCFPSSFSSLVPVTGCIAMNSDLDFDGPSYQPDQWPGTGGKADKQRHPTSITFTSATYDGNHDYGQIAFEADMPAIEPTCNTATGAGCTNPPPGAAFYPLYTTGTSRSHCIFRNGGTGIPGMTSDFGGTTSAEYGPLLQLSYPAHDRAGNFVPVFAFNDFRNVLPANPCPYGT
jgi:hypothetical protein